MKKNGSIMILTIIAVLILSLLVSGLLTVGTTEIHTTQNYLMSKTSYYFAVQGMEMVIESVRNTESPADIAVQETQTEGGVTQKKYITGTVLDLQSGTPQNIEIFQGFAPPPIPNMSLGTETGMVPVVWRIPITAEIIQNRRKAYTELQTGVYTLMKEY
jgi:hypothetical protein